MAWIRCTGNTGGSLKVRTASGRIATFETNMADVLQEVKCEINASGGNGTPDNPNPINGYTKANITRCGVNLWDEEWENGDISSSTGEKTTGSLVITKNFIPVKPNTVCYSNITLRTRWYDAQKNYIGSNPTITANTTFTVPANAHYLMFTTQLGYGLTYKHDISINYPATDTQYHAYTGNTYAVSFGQTVYGGVLDVTRRKLTVTHGSLDLGALSWTYRNDTNPNAPYFYASTPSTPDNVKYKGAYYSTNYGLLCSIYSCVARGNFPNTDFTICVDGAGDMPLQFQIKNSNYTDASLFATAMNGIMLVYELATPFDIDLTPVQVEQLLGKNNVWHDGNGNTEVKYLEVVRN